MLLASSQVAQASGASRPAVLSSVSHQASGRAPAGRRPDVLSLMLHGQLRSKRQAALVASVCYAVEEKTKWLMLPALKVAQSVADGRAAWPTKLHSR